MFHYSLTRDLVVGSNFATVADKLETSNNLANGEKAENLGGDNTTSGKLGCAQVAGLLEEGSGVDRAGLDGFEETLVVSLEAGNGRRSHATAFDNVLAKLEADLGIIDGEGELSLNEADDLASGAADFAESRGNTLGVTGDGGTSGIGDAGKALLGLGCCFLGGLSSLLRGSALTSTGGEAQGWGA